MILLKELNDGLELPYQIYIDLDGTLSDFDGRFEHYTGVTPNEWREKAYLEFGEKKATEKFWHIIDEQIGVRYWRGMSFLSEGQKLWEYIKQYNPSILTAPSRNEVSKIGKKLWVQDNLGSNTKIEFRSAEKKHELSGPDIILIDDLEKNIISWKSKNGIGILFKNYANSIINELKKIGL